MRLFAHKFAAVRSSSSRALRRVVALSALLIAPVALAETKPAASGSASAAAPSASTLPSLSVSDVAAKIQATYQAITTYEADFDQQFDMKAFGDKKTTKGHVTFEKPGKMRWDYTDPKSNLVVSDGTTLWSYTAKDNKANTMQLKDSQMPTALAFLTGKGDLTKEFTLTFLDMKEFKGGYVLKGVPKTATNLYSYVCFYVDGTTFQVRRVLIVDAQDNRNRFDFTKPAVGNKYDASKFKWTPPAGVTVVKS
jgi:outer membrane lipoprotein carrier protein